MILPRKLIFASLLVTAVLLSKVVAESENGSPSQERLGARGKRIHNPQAADRDLLTVGMDDVGGFLVNLFQVGNFSLVRFLSFFRSLFAGPLGTTEPPTIAPTFSPTFSPTAPPTTPPTPEPTTPPTSEPTEPPTTPPTPAPTTPPTASPTLEACLETRISPSTDWIQAPLGLGCNTACSCVGGTCDASKQGEVDSADGITELAALIDGASCGVTRASASGFSPSQNDSTQACVYNAFRISECGPSPGTERRFCCCGSNCPTNPNGTPDPPSCANTLTSSTTDWIQGPRTFSCDEACACVGGTCSSSDQNLVQTQDLLEEVVALIQGASCLRTNGGGSTGTPLQNFLTGVCFAAFNDNSDCGRRVAGGGRFCCCGGNCPVSSAS